MIKNQKPIDSDIHFKYLCPKKECFATHWLSLRETQTKNFKVVCDCGTTFKPKRINKIKIVYLKAQKDQQNISTELLDDSIKILTQYGFTTEEVTELYNKHYCKAKASTAASLVKYILQNLETSYEQH